MFRRAEPSLVSFHAAHHDGAVALCAALALPSADAGAPEWVQLLPAGEIVTNDGRGPYRVGDTAQLIATSLELMAQAGVVDENHATDLAAPRGEAAPARGWIKELQARADGIWGRVEWTAAGARLVSGRAYRGISPVIAHKKDGTITAILRASLVNKPNLRGLAALHQEEGPDMEKLLEQLLKALGLPEDTKAEKVLETVTALHAEAAKDTTALQAALSPIAKAAGLKDDADAAAVLAGVEQLATKASAGAGDSGETITALQAELTDVTKKLNALTETGARDKATAFVDAAIKAGHVGVKPLRDHYIARHMANPADVEKEITAFPKLGASGALETPPAKTGDGKIALQADQSKVARMLGLTDEAYAKTLAAQAEEVL